MKERLARGAAFFPAAAWYILIWVFSGQNGEASDGLSNGLLYRLLEACSARFREHTPDGKQAIVDFLSFFERKAAHMFLYFVLTGLLIAAVRRALPGRGHKMTVAIGACALLAALDELHQRFVPGRSGVFRDVLVDVAGGACFLLLYWLVHCVRVARRIEKRSDAQPDRREDS